MLIFRGDMRKVIKRKPYIADMNRFNAINEVKEGEALAIWRDIVDKVTNKLVITDNRCVR